MDSASTPWSPHPPSVQAETLAPTIFPRVGYSILSFLMFINTVLTIFNNGLAITVMLRNPSLLQSINIFILSLAVSDLMIGLCGSLVVTITNYQGSFFIGHTACVFQGFAVNYFGECRALLLEIHSPFVCAWSVTSCFTLNKLGFQFEILGKNFLLWKKKSPCSHLKIYKTERVNMFSLDEKFQKFLLSAAPRELPLS